MFQRLMALAAMTSMLFLGACASTAVGPYNGLTSTPAAAIHKIGCFDYHDRLDPHKEAVCEAMAATCQIQQNRMKSPLSETVVSNGAVSAGLGAGSENATVRLLGAASRAGPYSAVGAVAGALGSVNQSLLIYSQSQDSAVGSCSRDFLTRYKHLHPSENVDDLYIEVETVRADPVKNVTAHGERGVVNP